MKAIDLLEAMGDMDEKDVAIAHARKSRKPLYITVGSIAAGLLVVIMVPILVMNMLRFGAAFDPPGSGGDAAPPPNAGDESMMQSETVHIDVVSKDRAYPIHEAAVLSEMHSILSEVLGAGASDSADHLPGTALLAEGEYRLILTDRFGEIREFLLKSNTLSSYHTGLLYTLTDEQTQRLYALLLQE